MTDAIRNAVTAFNQANDYETDDESLVETILEAQLIWRGEEKPRRHWSDRFCVVEINGFKIGFMGASTTGDDSPSDKGWKFDPSTICEVESETKQIVTYKPKGSK